MSEAERYKAQLSLPGIGPAEQAQLHKARIVMIGAGGLGAAALPYLAGAGIGHITVIDHDIIQRDNLHRQTIYKDAQIGKLKAECTATYLRALNPDIQVKPVIEKLNRGNAETLCNGFDLILDGSDNFETKLLLNHTSIATKTPLLSASLERFNAMLGIFAGYEENSPCYSCLFPEIPFDACNCSDAGLLGTAAGIAGLYQAHIALCLLLNMADLNPGFALSVDLTAFRTQKITVEKNPACETCNTHNHTTKEKQKMTPVQIIQPEEVRARQCLIIDVRTSDEIAADPIEGAMHMELGTIPSRYKELPIDKPLAFACAANVRSMKAAEFLRLMGYEDVCVMNRLP